MRFETVLLLLAPALATAAFTNSTGPAVTTSGVALPSGSGVSSNSTATKTTGHKSTDVVTATASGSGAATGSATKSGSGSAPSGTNDASAMNAGNSVAAFALAAGVMVAGLI